MLTARPNLGLKHFGAVNPEGSLEDFNLGMGGTPGLIEAREHAAHMRLMLGLPGGFSRYHRISSDPFQREYHPSVAIGVPLCPSCGKPHGSITVQSRYGTFYDGHPISVITLSGPADSCCISGAAGSAVIVSRTQVEILAAQMRICPKEFEQAVLFHELGHAVSFMKGENTGSELADEYNAWRHARTTVEEGLPFSYSGVSEEMFALACFIGIRSRTDPSALHEVLLRGELSRFSIVNGLAREIPHSSPTHGGRTTFTLTQ